MFGMRHCGSHHEGRWAAGRHWRRGLRGGFFGGGGHGMGGGDMFRAGRMLAQGDLRLIALALIAEEPRHGYEIIRVLEEKTEGWYAPSPGIVYPTLTYLEEAGYVTAESAGAKKRYTITEEGRAYLEENRDFVDALLERLAAVGEKVSRMRRRLGRDEESERDNDALPGSVKGAFRELSEAVREALARDGHSRARVVEIIERATEELKKK